MDMASSSSSSRSDSNDTTNANNLSHTSIFHMCVSPSKRIQTLVHTFYIHDVDLDRRRACLVFLMPFRSLLVFYSNVYVIPTAPLMLLLLLAPAARSYSLCTYSGSRSTRTVENWIGVGIGSRFTLNSMCTNEINFFYFTLPLHHNITITHPIHVGVSQ